MNEQEANKAGKCPFPHGEMPVPMGKCPVMHGGNTSSEQTMKQWWPNSLNLDILHQHDSKEKFVRDFVAAWTKVMNADRFAC